MTSTGATAVDAFDLKILAALQEDGRLTNQELAEIAGLPRHSQCSRRRSRLEEEKIIQGYHADSRQRGARLQCHRGGAHHAGHPLAEQRQSAFFSQTWWGGLMPSRRPMR